MSISITNVNPVNGALPALLYDANGNPLVLADRALAQSAQAGVPQILLDDGVGRVARADITGAQGIAKYAHLFQDMVDGAVVNTQLWTQSLTTMTVTQATRLVTMNAGLSVAASVSAIRTSLRQFIRPPGSVLRFTTRARFNWQATNAVMECGFGNPVAATAAVPTGAFVRVTAAGAVQAVISYSNSETTSADLCTIGTGANQLNPSYYYQVNVFLADDNVRFVIQLSDDTTAGQVATLPIVDYTLRFPVAQIAEWSAISSPAFFRIYNNASGVTTASTLFYSSAAVSLHDIDTVKPWAEQRATAGGGLVINPASGVQLANYANNAAPVSATLSNTVAGYTTLGGQWQFAAVAPAETDYALFAFVVPTGRTLIMKAIRISTFNLVAAVATTPTLLQWGVGRAAAATLASSSFRQTIGSQSLAVGTPPGGMANQDVFFTWEGGFVVDSGQTLHIILKIPVATATPTEIIRGTAVIDGYLE
jgi:hypothetical protein